MNQKYMWPQPIVHLHSWLQSGRNWMTLAPRNNDTIRGYATNGYSTLLHRIVSLGDTQWWCEMEMQQVCTQLNWLSSAQFLIIVVLYLLLSSTTIFLQTALLILLTACIFSSHGLIAQQFCFSPTSILSSYEVSRQLSFIFLCFSGHLFWDRQISGPFF